MYQEAVYETTPTISNLEIFYETSTSGLVSEINTLSQGGGTIEVDYYNSYWLKRIKVLNPQTQISNITGADKSDFDANNNQKSFGGRGVGSSPSLGVFPLSSCFAAPLDLNNSTQQDVTSTTSKMPMLLYESSTTCLLYTSDAADE